MMEGRGNKRAGTTLTHLNDGKPKKLQECINQHRDGHKQEVIASQGKWRCQCYHKGW